MEGHHVDPSFGDVSGHPFESHQSRSDERFGDHEEKRDEREAAHRMAGWERAKGDDVERRDQDPQEPARQAMAELD